METNSSYELQGHSLLSVILTSAASRFCRVTGVTIEEAADLSGLSEDRRSREEPFPKGGQRGRDRDKIRETWKSWLFSQETTE